MGGSRKREELTLLRRFPRPLAPAMATVLEKDFETILKRDALAERPNVPSYDATLSAANGQTGA